MDPNGSIPWMIRVFRAQWHKTIQTRGDILRHLMQQQQQQELTLRVQLRLFGGIDCYEGAEGNGEESVLHFQQNSWNQRGATKITREYESSQVMKICRGSRASSGRGGRQPRRRDGAKRALLVHPPLDPPAILSSPAPYSLLQKSKSLQTKTNAGIAFNTLLNQNNRDNAFIEGCKLIDTTDRGCLSCWCRMQLECSELRALCHRRTAARTSCSKNNQVNCVLQELNCCIR